MSSLLHTHDQELTVTFASDLFLRHRLKVVEDLWESVLRQECGQELVDSLKQLRSLCSPEGQTPELPETSVPKLIEKLDLNSAIRASRAFALYFQLINIVEQHYEQREQQLSLRTNQHLPATNKAVLPTNISNNSPLRPIFSTRGVAA